MGQKGAHKQRALRYVVYIHALGGSPLPYAHKSYRGYAIDLQRQYDELRKQCPAEVAAAARIDGRSLIRLHSLSQAAERITPGCSCAGQLVVLKSEPVRGEFVANCSILKQQLPIFVGEDKRPSPRENRKAEFNCRRKLRHEDFWSALLHIRHLGREGVTIYPCGVCGGLHVGHDREHSKKRRLAKRELDHLDERLRALEQERMKLQERKRSLIEIIS